MLKIHETKEMKLSKDPNFLNEKGHELKNLVMMHSNCRMRMFETTAKKEKAMKQKGGGVVYTERDIVEVCPTRL